MAYSKPAKSAAKRPTNVSLSDSLLLEAKALGINISQAAERGLAQAIRESQIELWLSENRAALESSNNYVAEHGLPLARYRQF